ncbi:MAG: epoxyalkane--coenzyme M transferase, partial [Acidimicrobiales bacterium]
SPGVIALFAPDEHYGNLDAYLEAIGEAMKVEYEAIVAAGIVLQIDAPDLAMGRHIMYRDRSDEEFVASVERHVDAINTALRDVPADRVRLHLCWGNYEGPHHLDIALDKIIAAIMRAKPATILFEAANPRHAHEHVVWGSAQIPDDKVLAPGVIDTTTNFIEHPELIAQRICRYADIVGPDRVLAATDCGFGTWSGFGAIEPEIGWAKLGALAQGAAIASERLF